jgi:predicted kinase
VRMRRLPDQFSAQALLERAALKPDALALLAERLATFLASARPVPEFGSVDAMRVNVEENFAQVEPFVGDIIDGSSFQEVRRFQLGALANHADRFAARVGEGRIREGHGDLRLEHVYFLPPPDGIVVIDCIEFNDRFRSGDAAGEAAFLGMELEAAGRPDLALAFLARFAEASDDFGLFGVIDFYLSYRAWVRGKVAAFLSSDPSADAHLRARKRDEARCDFALARSFSGVPVDAPFVIAIGGMIGSGKSTLAAALGRELAAPVVSSDRTRKAMAGLGATDRGDERLYTPEAVERTYREVLRRAGQVLASGRGVILDATFHARRWRLAAAELARTAGVRFAHVETRCADRQLLRARLAERRTKPAVSDATDAELEKITGLYEPLESDEPGPLIAVETGGDPERALASAMDQLAAAGVLPADVRRRA